MRVRRAEHGFVIERGNEYRPTYFAMWVDADKTSWSCLLLNAAWFATEEAATKAIKRIRDRDKARRLNRA